jgi:hypothetical protein
LDAIAEEGVVPGADAEEHRHTPGHLQVGEPGSARSPANWPGVGGHERQVVAGVLGNDAASEAQELGS